MDSVNWGDRFFYDLGSHKTSFRGKLTKEISVEVFEMVKDGTFAQIFGSFGKNLDRLCLREGQIIYFMKNHGKWFGTDKPSAFFLLKENWSATCRRRVVVPEL
jgi:hypothetical protein